ncbi:siderophore-interacting protein [Rhizobium sp. L1K21]|uniref:siderophore-interacting protein n=1 Tax=Rhizobium sp. L1K21 TaxID=2954933 RepID=UPI00209292A8|nr:siderophore-interacting protein [Rhizobium sp. L1K21]MCO6187565.1 siderophore-interacting protein [Rhizobium sp. L1K21]
MSAEAKHSTPVIDRTPQRHRFDLRLRHLHVKRLEKVGASMMRVTLSGPELEGFKSLGFDDHVKMFFPAEGRSEPVLPIIGPNGVEFPKGEDKPIARDYTPRRYDADSGELDIDFLLGHDGPASQWAAKVKQGDSAWVAGPRGSFVVPFDFDWHLLIADETGLPALARRLEELPASARAVVIVEVETVDDRIDLRTEADIVETWVCRSQTTGEADQILLNALREQTLPAGDFHSWIACESAAAKNLRHYLVNDVGTNPKWVRASGYWRRGATGVHDHFEE